jgi:hypothetical protein
MEQGKRGIIMLLEPSADLSQVLRASLVVHKATSNGSLAPCRCIGWKDRINEQVLHGAVGQIPADKGLVVVREPIGDLCDAALAPTAV